MLVSLKPTCTRIKHNIVVRKSVQYIDRMIIQCPIEEEIL